MKYMHRYSQILVLLVFVFFIGINNINNLHAQEEKYEPVKPLNERKFSLNFFYFAHDLSYQIASLGIPIYTLESDIIFDTSFGMSISRYITENFSVGFQFLKNDGGYETTYLQGEERSRKIEQNAFLIDLSYDLLKKRINTKLVKYINPYMSVSLGSHMFNIDYYEHITNTNPEAIQNSEDGVDCNNIGDFIRNNSNFDFSHLGFNLTMSFGAKIFLNEGFAVYTALSKISIFSFPRLVIVEYTNFYETLLKFGIEFRI